MEFARYQKQQQKVGLDLAAMRYEGNHENEAF